MVRFSNEENTENFLLSLEKFLQLISSKDIRLEWATWEWSIPLGKESKMHFFKIIYSYWDDDGKKVYKKIHNIW